MENLHKIVFWFESTNDQASLSGYLAAELVIVADAIRDDYFDPNDKMESDSKLTEAPWVPVTGERISRNRRRARSTACWEWYGKLASDTANEAAKREGGTQEAADEMARRMLAVLKKDPHTVGTPQRVK